ncbi:AsmA family protein [Halomonas sp. 18H]|uniref:AsmA family protein n=1 Tax=Halomonas almeriensis TaxID=308163 RepID=UPI00222FD638|nr:MULTISPECIES: AsmA family protein [Halomonas]MCW4152977.1 AsmA family protein [Halomonas sp. 18H]MDN3554340.1 AsmA family protein [Halomonas almeriensis]
MKRILRTLLATIGILGLVAVAAVVFVTTFFDPDDLKPRLVDVVREHSGLELELDGPLTWSFYPRLGVSVASAEARLPEQGLQDRPFAAFEHGEVSLAFAPLLGGEIAIEGLTLDGLRLNLERDAEGRGNWQGLVDRLRDRGEQAEQALAPASAGPSPDGTVLSVALNIASVQVRQGQIHYRDRQSGNEVTLQQFSMTGSNVNPDEAFPLNASLRLVLDDSRANEAPLLISDVTLKTRVDLGLAEGRHVLQKLTLQADSRFAGDESTQKASLNAAEAIFDQDQQQLELTDGQLDVSLLDPRLGEKRLPLAIGFQLDADLAEQTAQLREITLTGPDGLEATGRLKFSELVPTWAYAGQVSLKPLSLRPWLTRLDALPTTSSDTALDSLGLTSSLEGDRHGLTLSDLTLNLDDRTFNGQLGGRFDGSRLMLDLQGDGLNLDAYLPPQAPDAEGQDSASLNPVEQAHAQPTSGLLPADWLGGLDLDASLELGELQLLKQSFRDVVLRLQGEQGQHRLTHLEAGFHEGRLSATGVLDARQSPLAWQLSPTVSDVRLGSLMASLAEQPTAIQGRLQSSGSLESQGNTLPELKRALSGRLDARLDKGQLGEVNISRQLCSTVASLEGKRTSREWQAVTPIESARASFVIRDGVAQSDDLSASIPGIGIEGQGQLDVASERFDLNARARFTDTVDAACEVNPRLQEVPFPVHCEGQLSGDSAQWCRFDRQALQASLGALLREEVSERAGEEVNKRLDDAMDQLENRTGSELRNAIESLLK